MSFQIFDLSRSITKKQTVAITGLMLISFVLVHLAGNLFIFDGPKPFNEYAEHLERFGIFKKIAEWALFLVFLIHIERVTSLVVQNIRAAGGLKRYAVDNSRGPRSLATRLMPFTGTFLFLYLICHLYDFAWANDQGIRSMINGKSLGLYGLVVNSFKNPIHCWLYVVAMYCLCLHLTHGVESFFQTFGIQDSRFTLLVRKLSRVFALMIMIAYSSIPLYVLYILKI
ncbi:MAG: succinate dehydrogenase cytochrome b subunit [Candidatus Omnitrophica bacterium]|nr:succinate dehydrogenase cytochrome b subunit [Candidatus Omnitrophota bacterium]